MKYACHYSIVRFLPYVETGEFANVGIALLSPQNRFFGSRVVERGWARLSRFFEGLDRRIYQDAIRAIRDELERVRSLVRTGGEHQELSHLFFELTKISQGIIRFSPVRALVTPDPRAALDRLFDFYVLRNFATRENQEMLMERTIRGMLKKEAIATFYPRKTLGNYDFNVTIPFVYMEQERAVAAIKPLNLSHADPSSIIDHGGRWVDRMRRLQARNQLPEQTLFALKEPRDDYKRERAAAEIRAELRSIGLKTAPFEDKEGILRFAAAIPQIVASFERRSHP